MCQFQGKITFVVYLYREGLAPSSVTTLAPQAYCRGVQGERGSPDPIHHLLHVDLGFRNINVSFELRGSD